MEITKEMLEERLAVLTRDAEQTMNLYQAVRGAIQDCQHWLAVLQGPEPREAGMGGGS